MELLARAGSSCLLIWSNHFDSSWAGRRTGGGREDAAADETVSGGDVDGEDPGGFGAGDGVGISHRVRLASVEPRRPRFLGSTRGRREFQEARSGTC